jgi:hypothetical protein
MFSVFKQMTMEGIKPNEVTYVFFLNVCRFLIPARERERQFSQMKAIFEMCCKDGLVNKNHIRILKESLTEKHFFQLVGAENVASKLPQIWSRNVSFSPKHK